MLHVFVDFEMNPIDRRFAEPRKISKQEIIEIGAVMLDDALRQVSDFRQYVRPVYGPLQHTVRRITRIRPAMLSGAPGFCEAMTRFLDWCGGDCRLYTWGPNDLMAVRDEAALKKFADPRLEESYPRWEDFQQTFVRLLGLDHRISLKDAVGSAQNVFTGRAHEALWDAKNTADLFRLSRDEALFARRRESILLALQPPAPPEEETSGPETDPEAASKAAPEEDAVAH